MTKSLRQQIIDLKWPSPFKLREILLKMLNNSSKTEVNAGNNVTITGDGSSENPYIINATGSSLQAGTNVIITGSGTSDNPYIINSSGGGSGGELEKITEGGKTGYRIKGRDVANYGDIGEQAVDLSFSEVENQGATGDYSFAVGQDSTASGYASHVSGYANQATEFAAHAEGLSCVASGNASHAEGSITLAEGNASHSEGNSNIAYGDASHVEGAYNTAESFAEHVGGCFAEVIAAESATNHDPLDYAYRVGIGVDSDTRKDGFRVRKNGQIEMPGFTPFNFADDTAAATGGVPVGGLYHTSGVVKIRLS